MSIRGSYATGDTKDLDTVVQPAKVLMAVSEQEQAAAAISESLSEVEHLKTQITQLTEQVAALMYNTSKECRV